MTSVLAFMFFVFILLPTSLVAQNNTIRVGDSLIAGDPQARPLISPSGDFAFGFRKLETKDLYLLAIWYNKIQDKTIVWYANIDNDPALPPNSNVTLTSETGLLLNGPHGNQIWRSEISTNEAAAGGFLNDTGNFIVSDRNGERLWESFDNPTDTLLPMQVMQVNSVVSSRLTETNFSRGRFQFRLLEDGNAVLNTINLPTGFAYDAYYWSNTTDATNMSNRGRQVVFNEYGYLYVITRSNQTKLLTPERAVLSEEFYYRTTLNFDGVFVIYSHPKTSIGNWSLIRAMPENICKALINEQFGTGPCGYNGICTLSVGFRPSCKCPPSFSLLDPNDEYGGCKPDFNTQICDGSILPENYTFQELLNTNFPYGDYERYPNYDLSKCLEACRNDCFCNLVILGQTACWKKRLPLANGRQESTDGAIAYLKVPQAISENHSPFPQDKKNDNKTLILIVSMLLGCSVLANFLFAGGLSYGFLSYYHKKIALATRTLRTVESNVRSFCYKELEEATKGFKEELGRGSFGIVYKGIMEISIRTAIAVKKLDRVIRESEQEFKTEVDVIAQTHHKNLVRLIGYCDEGQHRLLVYEFVSNGTLAQFLCDEIKLRWEQRIQIAIGVAKGLLYLHDECITQIIHCDIKPQNILLDDDYNVKIADFGLAKLLFRDKSKTLTAIRGTKGYVAAEWYRNLPITAKVDVYSYGVVLLEIICGRRNVNEKLDDERAILTDWVYDCYLEGTIEALVEDDEEALGDKKRLESFVKIGIWCVQEEPNLRPTMKQVMLMLEGVIQVPVPPCPYPLAIVA